MIVPLVPADRGGCLLTDVADCQARDGGPQRVIRRKHAMVPMPVLPRRRDEIREPIQKLKRRELHDAVGSRPCGRSLPAGPDPAGGFVSWEHVADCDNAAVIIPDHRESFQREGRPGAVSQEMLEAFEIARHVVVY